MASKKKASEGIALLSMYNDEDEDMEDLDEDAEEDEETREDMVASVSSPQTSATPPLPNDDFTPKSDRVAPLTPQQPQTSLPPSPLNQLPPLQPSPHLEGQRTRKGTLAIVDYAHDETAMSPEAEEGEIVSSGRVTLTAELQTANGEFQEKSPPGTVQILTPGTQPTPPQMSEQPELLQLNNSAMMNSIRMETEATGVEDVVMVSVEIQEDDDPLDKFLPPPPKTKCSEELQEKINRFLAYKRAGKSFNAEVRNRKDYRNPDFLLHAVRYQDIDQIGSCFSKDVFDPHGYEKSDYYDEIEADMKREMERKEQERKKSPKGDFIAGGTLPGTVAAAQKISIIPGVSTVPASGLHSLPPASDGMTKDGRQNKKSKWDKVDGDRRPDSVSTVGAHAALLSAANVGAGYTAFA
ncbi:PREDICTED: uncharacterized protein LOC104609535 isoform X2 [Nelumbo nucifera]|nr:PREDICTED: uncharacterized protein LOC104609535 isoform X2 [Nelumbo nucifera]